MAPDSLETLNHDIVNCSACPRLSDWRTVVALTKRKSYRDEVYWGRAVPNFGDPRAAGLILGLAPAAHGANRTGRMFTGDQSGIWLFRALHRAGLASQPNADSLDDGLVLHRILITAAVHCAPPDNKPTTTEVSTCRPFLTRLLSIQDFKATLCLGGLAWKEYHQALGIVAPTFSHGALSGTVLASYHPSQQNTFTKRLTEPMLDDVVERFKAML